MNQKHNGVAGQIRTADVHKENAMRLNSTIKKWARMALPAALAVSVMPAALAKSVRLDVEMSTPTVLTGARQKAFVRIALTGLTPRVNRRAPVNVAIVLDRSGSMSGTKIEEAKARRADGHRSAQRR